MNNIKPGQWYRICQECGNEQVAMPIEGDPSDGYRNSKCRKCKSPALDYGKFMPEPEPEAPVLIGFGNKLRQITQKEFCHICDAVEVYLDGTKHPESPEEIELRMELLNLWDKLLLIQQECD